MSDSTRQSVLFGEGFDRPVTAGFDAQAVTSDGGAILLRAMDRRLHLSERLAACVQDERDPAKVEHGVADLIRQRVYSIALGYPEVNAVERLGADPALALAVRGECASGRALASQPTLSRWENAPTARELLAMGAVLLHSAVEGLARQDPCPARVVIDIDPSVDPAYGEQQGVLFNGFYDAHCFLPVFGFLSVEGRPGHHLFLARLRPGNATAWRATRRPLRDVIRAVSTRFPQARILVRMDAAYGRGRLLDFLESQNVEYLVGIHSNVRLAELAAPALARTHARTTRTGRESREVVVRRYRAGPWRTTRRVIVRAQAALQPGRAVKATARFVLTNTSFSPAQAYEMHCRRGDAENRIKELKDDLEIDRTSCSRFGANQFRVMLTAAAYVLMDGLRERASRTDLATAQVGRLRMALLRIGARVTTSVRRVVLHLAAAHPWATQWRHVALRVGALSG
jgi:hypothetical protein